MRRGRNPAARLGPLQPVTASSSFKEKPDAATAAKYLASGEYYWNSGIFVWRASTILDALRKRQPEMLEHLEKIVAAWDTPQRDAVFEREFAAIKPISIDYAVMEHATDVAVIEAPFEWDDLGGWQSLARLAGSDENGNTIIGKHLGVNTAGTIVRTDDDHLVVTLGLKDCIVVHTPNATLVASKHSEEQIRQVVKELEARGWHGLPVTSNRDQRESPALTMARCGSALRTADLDVGIAGPFENYTRRSLELDAKYFAELRHAGEDRAVRGRAAGPFERPESQKSTEARKFGEWLGKVTGVPVEYFDERFTTSEADQILGIGQADEETETGAAGSTGCPNHADCLSGIGRPRRRTHAGRD